MTMEETLVEKEISNLDLKKIGALQQKRTIAFVNHFIISTVQFLNNFMRDCEMKLMDFERRLENVNASVVLLEDRLSSIPEVRTPLETDHNSENNTLDKSIEHSSIEPIKETEEVVKEAEEETKSPQISPEYEKFVKMVHVGVPLQAVKIKVTLEGLDPNVLESILK